MINKFKRASNAVRQIFGASPTIVTTSPGTVIVPDISLLALAFTKGKSGIDMIDAETYYVATTNSHKNTKNALWNIDRVAAEASPPVARRGKNMSFDAMTAFMQERELAFARQAGFKGTNEEIMARRRTAVPKSNILNLK